MAIFKCNVCGYLYDEAGNTLFSALPDDWRCPICGAEKAKFTKVKETSEKSKTEDIPKDNPLAYPKEYGHDSSNVVNGRIYYFPYGYTFVNCQLE